MKFAKFKKALTMVVICGILLGVLVVPAGANPPDGVYYIQNIERVASGHDHQYLNNNIGSL